MGDRASCLIERFLRNNICENCSNWKLAGLSQWFSGAAAVLVIQGIRLSDSSIERRVVVDELEHSR